MALADWQRVQPGGASPEAQLTGKLQPGDVWASECWCGTLAQGGLAGMTAHQLVVHGHTGPPKEDG